MSFDTQSGWQVSPPAVLIDRAMYLWVYNVLLDSAGTEICAVTKLRVVRFGGPRWHVVWADGTSVDFATANQVTGAIDAAIQHKL